jgi:hypothetical protein
MTLKEKFEDVTDFIEWDTNEVNPQEQRVKIADEFAIGFAEWLRGDYYSFGDGWMPFGKLKQNNFTNKDLLKIYKKEKGL